MADITAQVIRELAILRGTAYALQASAERLTELFSGTEVMAADATPPGCHHPPNQRRDDTTMGDEAGSKWTCLACGYQYQKGGDV